MRRGLSLLEVLVATTLTGIIGSLTFLLFHRVFVFSHRQLERSTRTQQALQVYRQWLKDLNRATPNSLTWASDVGLEHQKVLAIQPLEKVSDAAHPVYSQTSLIVYRYFPLSSTLWRQSFYRGVAGVSLNPDLPTRLSLAELQALELAPDCQVRKTVGVPEWDLGSTAAYPLLSRKLHPKIVFSFVDARNQPVLFPMEQDFMLLACP